MPRFVLLLVGAELVLSICIALLFGFRTTDPLGFLPQLWCLGLIASAPLARRIEYRRLAATMESVGLFYGQGMALYALLYPLTAIAAPFADSKLAAADRLLGFDWLTFARFVAAHPPMLTALAVAYFSFMVQGVILLPLLIYRGLEERAWRLILASNIALVLCVLIYPFAPAAGTFVHFGIGQGDYPFVPFRVPWSFAPVIEAIRDHGVRLIDRNLFTSFVSFPSFHASAALLLAWAAWSIKWMRWPFLILNIAMAVSALIVGAHYLVDVLAGVAIGALSLALTRLYIEGLRLRDAPRGHATLSIEVSPR